MGPFLINGENDRPRSEKNRPERRAVDIYPPIFALLVSDNGLPRHRGTISALVNGGEGWSPR